MIGMNFRTNFSQKGKSQRKKIESLQNENKIFKNWMYDDDVNKMTFYFNF